MHSKRKTLRRNFIIFFTLYVALGAIGFFLIHKPQTVEKTPLLSYADFNDDKLGPDKVVILEERLNSAIARINLVENANSSIKIAYYAVHDGLASDIFYGSILKAANREVKVELLLDGMFHNLKGIEKRTLYALINHPNIKVRFYEPLNLLKPWTLNNRLHDKFIIVDETYVLLGGRNIGDKYYLESYSKAKVEDRDLLIFKTDATSSKKGVLPKFETYFSQLWNHPYTKQKKRTLLTKSKQSEIKKEKLLNNLNEISTQYPNLFNLNIEWDNYALATNKIELVTNPIQRLNKEPLILQQIITFTDSAKQEVLLQSPYIIPNNHMRSYYEEKNSEADFYYLTNSVYSSPNYFALAGYLKYRPQIASQSKYLFEYEGEGSIHAKTYIFDRQISMVGSFNLDARSSFLSTESMVIIDSAAVANQLALNMKELASQSVAFSEDNEQKQTSWTKLVLISLLRLIIYPFDFLL